MGRPRTLLFDIENSPIEGWAWSTFDTNLVGVKRPTYIMAWAARWLDEKKILARTLPDYPLYQTDPTNDSALLQELHQLLDEADIVIAHNANFDIKKTNGRFLINGIREPSPFKAFCTLALARKRFKLDSNRLDYLADVLGVGRKIRHPGFSLWQDCMQGCPKAWALMRKYNAHDVFLLHGCFEKMKGWATNFPDANWWTGAGCCPVCQGGRIQLRGYNVSRGGRKQRIHCQDCGHWDTIGKAVKDAA